MLLLLTILGVIFMEWLLKTRAGLALRATGSNARMGRAIGIDDHKMIHNSLIMNELRKKLSWRDGCSRQLFF